MHVHNCIMAVQVWLNIVWAAPALIFVQFFSTELITEFELSVRGLFHSRRKRLPSRYGIAQLHFSLLFTFENLVNMLWSFLRGDSFSNQLEWTGTHLYSSSRVRVAGKQSARYFQFGLAKHFLLCCESGLEAFFDEREARPQPEPVPWNKQWRELLTKRLEC